MTGEPGRAGSAPIASAATTPQPAGKSIPKYARPWRAYFEGVGGRSRLRRKATAWQSRCRADASGAMKQPFPEEWIRELPCSFGQ